LPLAPVQSEWSPLFIFESPSPSLEGRTACNDLCCHEPVCAVRPTAGEGGSLRSRPHEEQAPPTQGFCWNHLASEYVQPSAFAVGPLVEEGSSQFHDFSTGLDAPPSDVFQDFHLHLLSPDPQLDLLLDPYTLSSWTSSISASSLPASLNPASWSPSGVDVPRDHHLHTSTSSPSWDPPPQQSLSPQDDVGTSLMAPIQLTPNPTGNSHQSSVPCDVETKRQHPHLELEDLFPSNNGIKGSVADLGRER